MMSFPAVSAVTRTAKMSRRAVRGRRAALKQLMNHRIARFAGVAEPADDDLEDFRIAKPYVDADAPLFDLADDHVDRVVRNAEAGIDFAGMEALRSAPAARLR